CLKNVATHGHEGAGLGLAFGSQLGGDVHHPRSPRFVVMRELLRHLGANYLTWSAGVETGAPVVLSKRLEFSHHLAVPGPGGLDQCPENSPRRLILIY